jgi:hypothetical protein
MTAFRILNTRRSTERRAAPAWRSDLCRTEQLERARADACDAAQARMRALAAQAAATGCGGAATYRAHALRAIVGEAARAELAAVGYHPTRAAVQSGWAEVSAQLERHLRFEGATVRARHYGAAAGTALHLPTPQLEHLAATALENISAMGLWFPDLPSPAYGRWAPEALAALRDAALRGEAAAGPLAHIVAREGAECARVEKFRASQEAAARAARWHPTAIEAAEDVEADAARVNVAPLWPPPAPMRTAAGGDAAFQYSPYVVLSREVRQLVLLQRLRTRAVRMAQWAAAYAAATSSPVDAADALGDSSSIAPCDEAAAFQMGLSRNTSAGPAEWSSGDDASEVPGDSSTDEPPLPQVFGLASADSDAGIDGDAAADCSAIVARPLDSSADGAAHPDDDCGVARLATSHSSPPGRGRDAACEAKRKRLAAAHQQQREMREQRQRIGALTH